MEYLPPAMMMLAAATIIAAVADFFYEMRETRNRQRVDHWFDRMDRLMKDERDRMKFLEDEVRRSIYAKEERKSA